MLYIILLIFLIFSWASKTVLEKENDALRAKLKELTEPKPEREEEIVEKEI